MVRGKLSVPGRPTTWMIVGQGPIVLAVGACRGCSDIFTLLSPFFPLSPSLWETTQYRLKYYINYPCEPGKFWWDCAEIQSDFSVFCSCML